MASTESAEIDFTNLSNDIDEDDEDFVDGTGLITKEMIEEEEKMHLKTLEEEQILKEKAAADKQRSEQCYKRLQHLLSRSNFYTQFLLKKIEEQLEQKKKAEEKAATMQKERQKLKELPVQQENLFVNRQTRSAQQEPKSSQGSDSEPNRKRKLEDSTKKVYAKKAKNFKIVDIVDKESLAQCAGSSKSNEKSKESSSVDNYSRTIGNERVSDKQPELFIGGVMRDYQLEGLEWLKVLYENGVNGILGDEMGLGKTIQCIALIAHLVKMGCPGPFLICAPLSTLPNWLSEFQRFTPKVPAVLYHGDPTERGNLRKTIATKKNVEGRLIHPIVITSYEIVMKDRKYFQKYEWRYIIIDEGHRIKNFKCKLFSELKKYRSVNRLLLTGTPLQNNLSELWSLLNFLLPEIFDELEVFESWFNVRSLATQGEDEKIIEQEQEKDVIATIHQILSPFMLRRTKKDVELNLPPKKELLVYAPLMPPQEKYYSAALQKTIRELMFPDSGNDADKEGLDKHRSCIKEVNYADFDSENLEVVAKALQAVAPLSKSNDWTCNDIREVHLQTRNYMMLFRKICNHPYLLEYPLDPFTQDYLMDENLVESCGKMRVLDCLLKALQKRGHKVLLFSQMTKMLDILGDYCYLRQYNYRRLDGSMNFQDRQEAIKEFNEDPGVFIFLLSTRAGGLGLNLTAADTVIIYDSDWNPQCDLQAQDRCHRIGQTRPVVIYRLITANTIDQSILERAQAKRKLEKMIIHEGKFSSMGHKNVKRQIDPKELLKLLRSHDHQGVVNSTRKEVFTPEQLEALLDRSTFQEKEKYSSDVDEKSEHNKVFKEIDIDD